MISYLTECDNVQILLNVVRKGVNNNMPCSFLMLTVFAVLELSSLLLVMASASEFFMEQVCSSKIFKKLGI